MVKNDEYGVNKPERKIAIIRKADVILTDRGSLSWLKMFSFL